MPAKFRIPQEHLADLEQIRSLGPNTLSDLAARLETLSPLPLTLTSLRKSLSATIEDDSATIALARQLIALNQLIRQRDMTVDEVLASLADGIRRTNNWTPEAKGQWADIEPQLRVLLNSDAIRTVSKASDLAYDHANLFQGARIVTDVRPVFNDLLGENMGIDGAVVSYTLRLHYDNREGDHSVSLALDETDILALKNQCERALEKARFVRDRMNKEAKIPTVISGEATDEDA